MSEPDFHTFDGRTISRIDSASKTFTIAAFSNLPPHIRKADWRIVLDETKQEKWYVVGGENERLWNNQLMLQAWSLDCLRDIETRKLTVQEASIGTESMLFYENKQALGGYMGACTLNAEGMSLVPGNSGYTPTLPLNAEQCQILIPTYEQTWNQAHPSVDFRKQVEFLSRTHPAAWVYYRACYKLLDDNEEIVDYQERYKDFYETSIWKDLFSYQKDGVQSMLEMMEKYDGCILADSVGLGKTYEALAVIKFYELLRKKVLVLCPKRLSENWKTFTQNDKYNPYVDDPFHYEILYHSDLGRKGGKSNGRSLDSVEWGRYDLVVIDESHNFRNRPTKADKESSRYNFLMEKVMKAGVKTKVLMLSATPVNNKASDLRNQILLISADNDDFLKDSGIESVKETTRRAQAEFTNWSKLPEEERTRENLMHSLNVDYFQILNLLTLGRSRQHIKKWYTDDAESVNMFPEQLPVLNKYAEAKDGGKVLPVEAINGDLLELSMAAYKPLGYVLDEYQGLYEKYNQKIADNREFTQKAREKNLSMLMITNLFKRMESSVNSFLLTLKKQIEIDEKLLKQMLQFDDKLTEADTNNDELDEEDAEELSDYTVGDKVTVQLGHIDRDRWKNDIQSDLKRLKDIQGKCYIAGCKEDAKLNLVRSIIEKKIAQPLNMVDGKPNRKVIIFTAFADTAEYLYKSLADDFLQDYRMHSAVITGNSKDTNLPGLNRKDQDTILAAFSPKSKKGFNPEENGGREIDLLIATDCISEGQNLQGCDFLINYDIHWNPVRIIQRFGRIDRIGSPNKKIQLVNIWPMPDLDAYINLESRVRAKMDFLKVSSTEAEFREKQLRRLRAGELDMDSSDQAYAISDLGMQQFRTDLAKFRSRNKGCIEHLPSYFTATLDVSGTGMTPGVFFVLRSHIKSKALHKRYPFANKFLIYVAEDGSILYDYMRVKDSLEKLKEIASNRTEVDSAAENQYMRQTKQAHDMSKYTRLLAAAVRSLSGQVETSQAASIFDSGDTLIGLENNTRGVADVEVLAMLILTKHES